MERKYQFIISIYRYELEEFATGSKATVSGRSGETAPPTHERLPRL